MSANERSVFQLLDAMRLNDKGKIASIKTAAKTLATMDEKIVIPLYTEHLYFLLSKCGWRVSKIRRHYRFEQKKSKRDFVIKNQVSRQKAYTGMEKDFYKLMNNADFGYDYRNNADNCYFLPIYDEIDELSYVKKYQNVLIKVLATLFHLKFLKDKLRKNF